MDVFLINYLGIVLNYNFKGLLLSIVNINDPRFLYFLSIHLPDRIGDVNTIDLKINPRPSLALYRLASLAVVRSILIENGKISISQLSDIHIDHYPSGAPFLGDNFPSLSVSHSGIWIGCLLGGEHKAVGLDIEDMGEEGNLTSRPYMELANYAFSPLEIDFVNRYQKEGFYRIWTAKEAIAKCQGQGLDYALELDLGEQFLDFFGSIDNQVEEKISFTLKVPTRNGVDTDFNIYSIGQQIIEKNLMVTVCEQKRASISS